MIISASRRTDIPAFYSEWFINRLKAGFVYVQNPRNPQRVTRVTLNTEVVDCIVFWTKNPRPMLNQLAVIDALGYPYYFQFTITPYNRQVETGLPAKCEIIDTFKQLSDKLGHQRVIWRYDPIIISKEFSVQYHFEAFDKMCGSLSAYTERCIFSFIDLYASVKNKAKRLVDCEVAELEMKQIAQGFSEIAEDHHLRLATCSEAVDFSSCGIYQAACIDQKLIENILKYPVKGKKDSNQRRECCCLESVDIGAYDSCAHGCVYCYATTSENRVYNNRRRHDPFANILVGQLHGDEITTVYAGKSLKNRQLSLL